MKARISWFVEIKRILPTSQAGLRPYKSTIDHIFQLEIEVKKGFAEKQSIVAVFLDTSKAYDCVWIQGLTYQLASIGLSRPLLTCLKNFFTGRTLFVTVSGLLSEFCPVLTGVPQGAVLSLFLLNLMLTDFPMPPPKVKILLYADDVTVHTTVKSPG